jgi:murein L,D-transpeptidase YcbB/YkuD
LLSTARKLRLLLLAALATVSLAMGFAPPAQDATVAPAQAAALKQIVASGRLADMRWPDFSDYKVLVDGFYAPAGYAPAWTKGGQPSAAALALIQAFRDAGKRGLEPEDYDASKWDARLQALKGPNANLATFDAALTVCAMRLVSDLHIGRINPQHFHFGLSVQGKKYDLPRMLREQVMTAADVSAVLDGVEPPFGGYRRTKAALARYVELARGPAVEPLPVPAKAIKPGQPYAGAAALRQRLVLLGDLKPDAAPAANGDVYGGALVEGVKRFQGRHGLDADGQLGPGTVKQLNVPIADRVRQLQYALERWRWLPTEFSSAPIIVNIPDFKLRAADAKGNVALEMRVVVGKAAPTQTPVFSRDMTYVVFRPYWNVPPSILRGEIVRAITRDRNYIANKNYEVTTPDGKVVTDGPISDDVLAQLKAGKLAVRQKPGPTNALGLVKLIFPNEFNVYLHSTPSQTLFAKSRRDFSHGCIRVEKPAELAAWALRNNPGWTLERAQEAMQTGPDNVTVKLERPVPVFIVYATALAYENGEVHFYDDIYGHDADLAQALAKGYPYPVN